ncbi:galactofuranosylgalactofuranosylrhamnosyl-N-acetylglucosaminyl-diphospho-decaprenol beta-1,5/1,6-galactofuranosyltransferase [Crossiella equi]|uniref:Galactofuranosylgalactofuranosylrhamnosyl-N-acetylglucosaminyl-diphospho-decaprenol beta-1,5/1,6-galactofuranosyltransferase n=1 Tax=Crossiella equi TaxID=130796 RepID=A0ABS5AFN1_9PSEU|nr:glycosyltransferase [Crossiella equi]MBP2475391.1 galactofuranosylgalactofuranosylrhamnosyl-N-acetylglucosaminyl-diphospho-decaprenol beta-1,5/1,6-galactofuranosyltransferase [Crossiella equi]
MSRPTTEQQSVNVPQQQSAPAGTLLQRIILPRPGDPLDVRALYLDEDKTNQRRAKPLSRTALRIPEQSEISFATYFNAFPASYWRRWTTLDSVELRLSVDGDCRVDLYRSKADGTQIHVSGEVREGGSRSDLRFTLDLGPFEDGGWYWFDITTEEEHEVTLLAAGWYATAAPLRQSSVAIGICTFNRPDDCVGALAAIGEDPLVLDAVRAVLVADQGTKKVNAAAGFEVAAARLGERLRVFDQPNLGGSGGFARVMHEAVKGTDCEQVLLMDDDIVIEPDSILRALAFARYTDNPMLVGGQMLNLQARSHLHSMGEVVDRRRFMWRAAPNVRYDHDFAREPLRYAGLLHRRIDVDYNGWWMCLIPRQVIEKIGLPLPLFIKWDDAEFGLRAGRAGYPTATLPGVAIWHMPWSDKDDSTDWQAYFHLRNRLVAAALYSPHARGGELVRHSLRSTMKHLLSLEYSTVALQDMAIRDFLAGPRSLFHKLPTALGEIREQRAEYDDGRVLPAARHLPLPSMDAVKAERFLRPPGTPLTIARTVVSALVRNVLPTNARHLVRPQLNIPAQDARWFLLARLDGATVATADGRGVAFRKRDPRLFWRLLSRALRNHVRLLREFPRSRKDFRRSLPDLTAHESWQRAFGGEQ